MNISIFKMLENLVLLIPLIICLLFAMDIFRTRNRMNDFIGDIEETSRYTRAYFCPQCHYGINIKKDNNCKNCGKELFVKDIGKVAGRNGSLDEYLTKVAMIKKGANQRQRSNNMVESKLQYTEIQNIKHDLKIIPQYFKDVKSGRKRFEVRIDDRNYQPGDMFILREWNGEYTGEYRIGIIQYVLRNCPEFGLMEGYCIFGW